MILHGDCLEEMKKFDANSIDLTVTSPPYDDLRSYNGLSFDNFKVCASEIYRITKPGGVCVWVVNDQTVNGSETGTSFKQALHFKDIGFNIHDTMIWQKYGVAFPETNRYYANFEFMFVLSKGKPKTVNLLKDRKNEAFGRRQSSTDRQKDGTTKPSSHKKTCPQGKFIPEYGVRFNVWKMHNHSRKENKHPAKFPFELARDHILTWSNEYDVVLDPFLGSGTTAAAAKMLNRKFIGIELNKEYLQIAEKRIEASA